LANNLCRVSSKWQTRPVYGKRDLSYGKRDLSYGERDLSYGERDLFYGKRDLSYGERDLSYGERDLSYGKRGVSYGKRELQFLAYPRDAWVSNETYLYCKRDLFILQKRPIYNATETYNP